MADTVRKRVLVVDDDRGVCRLLASQIAALGFDVKTALSAKEAHAAVEHQPADLALVDMRLAGDSGFDILKKWRENGRVRTTLMVTAYANAGLVEDCRKLGIDGFIEKPFDLEHVRLLMLRLLGEAAPGTAEEKEEVP